MKYAKRAILLNAKIKELQDEYEFCRNKIAQYALENHQNKFEHNNKRLSISFPTKIEYNLEKIKNTFSKKILKKIVKKRILIVKRDKVKEMQAKYKIPNKTIKCCFEFEEYLDQDELGKAVELNIIEHSELKKCYKIEKQKPRITIK